MEPIYLDFNATTPLDRAAAAEMRLYIDEEFGNPSSSHSFGIRARQAVELARKRIASLLNCSPDEIVFTSGGTESNNYAIKGAAFASRRKGNHIITSAIEHPSVLEVCRYLEREGFRVTYAGVDGYGMTDPAEIEAAITPETVLITVMHSNNEVGTIQPVAGIAQIASRRGILFHTDAAQSVGKVPVDVRELGVDLLSVAGHKLYAPKGIGALYIKRGTAIEKLIHGADHERNHRAGTENVIEIAGLGKAAEVAEKGLDKWARHSRSMRDRLHDALLLRIPGIRLNGHPEIRLPNTLSLSFPGVDAQAMLSGMKEVAASAGAACHADQVTVSGVLQAMKVPVRQSLGTIRFSVGRTTTEEEIDRAAAAICSVYDRLAPGSTENANRPEPTGVRLTEYTRSLGCACKIRPQSLEKILAGLPEPADANLLVGTETSDDAAVYRISDDLAIVQTVDFIPPVVDDPYAYGAIAAANALSDIYAMGGKPVFALSVVGFPEKALPLEVLREIMRGAADKVSEAGITIAGGHSIEDSEPKFGLVVTGLCHPGRILRNRGAEPGDLLVLTKPLGIGILTTAMKRGYASSEASEEAIRSMSELNRYACELLPGSAVHACTDITGFGLLGHLKGMIAGTEVDAEISYDKVPLLPGVKEYAEAGMVPGGSLSNLDFVSGLTDWGESIGETQKKILADAQTSGGLLLSMPGKDAKKFLAVWPATGRSRAAVIGKVFEGSGRIRVV
jgi:cysteine desulfurase NifS/selenium donor protein